MAKLPPWIRVRLSTGGRFGDVHAVLARAGLNTVCRSAHCPNEHECFGRGTATFMILGDTCTRRCGFCAVGGGRPGPVDADEPRRVAEAAAALRLRHVVITSVTRDDLADGGAGAFAATIAAVRAALPESSIEVLIPDLMGCERDLATVLAARPDVLNHNIETVRRLQAAIRPQASYERSLGVLRFATRFDPRPWVKSGIMLGLGEEPGEVSGALADLRAAGCEFLTIGQYLAPSAAHAPVARFVPPEEFDAYGRQALALGFRGVASGPLVRSSYHAAEMLAGGGADATSGRSTV